MQRSLPKRFWPHAIRAAAFKINLTPNIDGEFPYQLMFKRSPKRFIRLMRVFGCLAWVNIPKAKRNNKKLVSRTGPTVGNDDEGEIERRGDYQTSEGVDERVD